MPPHPLQRKTAKAFALFRNLAVFFLAICAVAIGGGAAHAQIVMTDAAGRTVRLEAPATRIVTNESLLLLSLAVIDPDPVARIAGWAAPQRLDSGVYDAFRKRFPAIEAIPTVGAVVPANASVQPDLFVVSIWQPDWESIATRVEAAGIPVLFLDGPANAARSPAEATAFSIELLGKALGNEVKAREFGTFVKARYSAVTERLKTVTERPNVLIDAHAGILCCSTSGTDNRLTQMQELAGGHSIGADIVPGYDGQLSAEYVLGIDPQVYIGTGGPHLAAQGGLVLGGAVDADAARASLRAAVGHNLLNELTAVREGRAYGVSHQLSISALSVLVFECFATWTHPALFDDLDPADTLAEINRRFMAVPLEGTFWVGLTDPAASAKP